MTAFYKVSGAGNDFIALIEPESDPGAEEVSAWCRRGLSIGADGVMALRPGADGEVLMRHWNADGGRAELCLNGSRCAVRLALELGWDRGGDVALHTDAGVLRGQSAGPDRIELEVPFTVEKPREVELETARGTFDGHLVLVGVPHLVIPSDGPVAEVDLAGVAPELRRHPGVGAAGANVNFVERVEENALAIRTWERGVEGETLACGTGAVASVVATVGLSTSPSGIGGEASPVAVRTAGGFELGVGGHAGGATLIGDARLVFRGEALSGSLG